MYVKEIHVRSFGTLTDFDAAPSRGLNVISGPNESGKTSIAMFIKFMLYGMPATRGPAATERKKYVNWKTGEASGTLVVVTDSGDEYRIQRTLADTSRGGKGTFKETVNLVREPGGVPVSCPGSIGEYLLGVPEAVFVNTAFVRQATGVKPEAEPLSRSVENMVTAADEKVNVKKALEELDRARIALLHKNKTGGMIKELEEERFALREKVESDKSNSDETVKVEASLDETRKKLSSAEENAKYFDELFSSLKVISDKRKLDAVAKAASDLEKTEKLLEKEKKTAPDGDCDGTVGMCGRNFEALAKAQANYDELPDPENDEDDEGDFEGDPFEDVRRSERLRSRSKARTAWGIVFLVLGILAAAGALVLKFMMNMPEWFYVAAGAAGAVLISVIFFALGSKSRSDLRSIIEDWGAPSADELAETVRIREQQRKDDLDLRQKKEKARSDLAAATAAAEGSREKLAQIAEKLSVSVPDGAGNDELLGAVKATVAERRSAVSRLESERAALTGRLAALKEQTADIDPAATVDGARAVLATETGKKAASMGQEAIREAAMKRDFCRGSMIELKKKETELDRRLAELRATAKSPAKAAEKLEKLDSLIEDLRRRHDAYVTAYEALSLAGDNLRSGVLPQVREIASDMMREISRGKYRGLSISPTMDLYFTDAEAGTREAELLSSGTEDAAYLSLRLSLIKTLFSGEGAEYPPVVFDESFARFDENRLGAAVALLSSKSFGLQSFLCTCREEEEKRAEKAGGNVIKL
ncbi:MAG: AAA family ATPase [Clostridia bacterium]|nr:AAA family ATPase [Clostridia bacterium]